tara:strand:+ start:133 stop:291 length:159 start_codon:yes stop_codon:yes gene_type:complete
MNYIFSERKAGDQSFVVADNKLLIELFNCYPKFNLENMYKDGWQWYIKILQD